ncbi:uncharacterized protein LOC130267785 isoform X2 [Hyla sarda]|nr:uncharacterized protein LOC130267785 isoform X2 [Hyla sarda]XP_056373951.1 uncharacterized protein LOC130267785 isoform X2 [Hyla sarda]XP_056373952.1 uncharacterized protein LOC130267785 isoform X2 [Hyla sarda]
MAENTNNGQERDQGHLLDKENQPNPLEQNQPKSASRMIQSPLQDSQLCNLTTNSEMRRIESTQDPIQTESGKLGDKRKSNWLTDMGKSLEEKMKEKNPEAKSSPGTKRKINTPKRSKSTSEKGPQSTVIKSDVKERKNFTAMPTEPKVSVSVSYRWINNGVECDTAGYNTPIIDFAKRTLEANPSLTKKSGYLQIHAQKLNAIVSPWAPCGALEQGEILEFDLKKKKSPNSSMEKCKGSDRIVGPEMFAYPTFHDGLFFKVESQGKTKGGQSRKIIVCKSYYSINYPMAVFGYPDQTIHEAFQNDKRFTIPGPFSLENSEGKKYKTNIFLSDLPPDTYKIVVHRRAMATSRSESNEKGVQSTSPGASVPQSETCVDPPDLLVPVSSRLSYKFSGEFKKLGKDIGQKNLESQLVNDYKTNVLYKGPMPATTLRLLSQHLDNVALLKYNVGESNTTGTLFLLTETLGLTCYHVVKLLIKSRAARNVEIIFNYEKTKEIFCGKYKGVAWANRKLDCAIVRVEIFPSPSGLLDYLAPPPQDGAVSIIGHPGGNPKEIDLNCSVIAFSQRASSIFDTILCNRSYIHVLTQHNFKRMNDPTYVTYDSCLYWGASGAPVFDNNGELVAMHTGGYPIVTPLKKKSVIEFGRSTAEIIIHAAVHLEKLHVPLRKLVNEKESLSKYLQPGGHPDTMQPVVRRLLKLWEESDRQMEQNSRVDVINLSGSPMDTL